MFSTHACSTYTRYTNVSLICVCIHTHAITYIYISSTQAFESSHAEAHSCMNTHACIHPWIYKHMCSHTYTHMFICSTYTCTWSFAQILVVFSCAAHPHVEPTPCSCVYMQYHSMCARAIYMCIHAISFQHVFFMVRELCSTK